LDPQPIKYNSFERNPKSLLFKSVANLCSEPLTIVHNAQKRFQVLKEAADPESGTTATFSDPHSRLTCSEELNVTGWIETRQRQYDCPSPTEVRDDSGRSLLQQGGCDIWLGRPWRRSFKRRRAQKLQVSAVSVKEPARSRVTCRAFDCHFSEVIAVLSKCKSPKQILNIN
jgi:hypothetical protein